MMKLLYGLVLLATASAYQINRRHVLSTLVAIPTAANAIQDSLDVDTFIRTGQDAGGNMGVSSQAGKSRPQTGVVFRDGTDVLQDKQGNVLAELLVGTKASPKAVLVNFQSGFGLETGPVFDVECRDARSGDGVFVAVTQAVDGVSVDKIPSSVIFERLFGPTGRFSFYGPPTDIKIKKDTMKGSNYRLLDVSFATLSQSTNSELPRRALVAATIPQGTDQAIMLVASAKASRWKSQESVLMETIDSFRAIPAPQTSLKLRPKDRSQSSLDF